MFDRESVGILSLWQFGIQFEGLHRSTIPSRQGGLVENVTDLAFSQSKSPQMSKRLKCRALTRAVVSHQNILGSELQLEIDETAKIVCEETCQHGSTINVTESFKSKS